MPGGPARGSTEEARHPAGATLLLAETPATFLVALPMLALRLGARMRVQAHMVDPGRNLDPYPVLRARTLDGTPRLVVLPGWEDEKRAFPLNARRKRAILDALHAGELPIADEEVLGLNTNTARGVMVFRLMCTAAAMSGPIRELRESLADLFHLTILHLDTGRAHPIPVVRIYGVTGLDAPPWMVVFPSYWGSRVHREERITDADLQPLMERLMQ